MNIRRCESDYAFFYLNNVDICLYETCNKVRCATGDVKDNICVNKWNCRNRFGNASNLGDSILNLRRQFWKLNDKEGKEKRAISLVKYLTPCVYKEKNMNKIRYHIGGVPVCKDYFRAATGFTRQYFSKVEKYVLGVSCISMAPNRRKKPFNDRVQTLLSYLDIYFGSDALVEHAPNSNQKHLRKTWKEFYQEDYLPWCTVNNEIPIPRNLFNSIRKHQRPHYVKSSKMRKRGFDVTSCSTCDTFEVLEAKCKDAEDYRKIRNAHEGHMGKATAHRRHYASTRTKATTVINRNSDMSMILDAAGGSGSTRFPHYASHGKNEPPRHKLLSIKCTFAKVHGLSTKIFVSFPDLETQGACLSLETIYDCVHMFLLKRKVKSIRNLYIQADNASGNKNWTLLAGLAVLVLFGIVRKVKLSFCLTGHTHEDIDAIIGNVISRLRSKDIISFEDLKAECFKAIEEQHAVVEDVALVCGMPNYDVVYHEFNHKHIVGITDVHQIRITSNATGDGIVLHYKEEVTDAGWLPRPIIPDESEKDNWKHFFVSRYANQGEPARIISCSGITEKGARQHWDYKVQFDGGNIEHFIIPADSLPVQLNKHAVIEHLKNGIPRQPFFPKWFENVDVLKENIQTLLRCRNAPTGSDKIWDDIFGMFPKSIDDELFLLRNYSNALNRLFETYYNNNVQIKPSSESETAVRALNYVDPITFIGGPLTEAQRKSILQLRGLNFLRRKKYKKKDKDEKKKQQKTGSINKSSLLKKRKLKVAFTDDENFSEKDGESVVSNNYVKRKRRTNKWIPVNHNDPSVVQYIDAIGKCFIDSELSITFKIVNIFQNEIYGDTLFFGYENANHNSSTSSALSSESNMDSLDYSACDSIIQEQEGFKFCC